MGKKRCLQASSDGASCIGVDEKMCAKCEWLSLMGDWCDNGLWQKVIFPHADGVFFMKGRLKFLGEDGKERQGAGCGSVLVAFGQDNVDGIINSCIEGTMLYTRRYEDRTDRR